MILKLITEDMKWEWGEREGGGEDNGGGHFKVMFLSIDLFLNLGHCREFLTSSHWYVNIYQCHIKSSQSKY